MIMAAPFPSGVSQNVQIFLPLTDLDHRTHSWGCKSRARTQTHTPQAHTGIQLLNCSMNVIV